MIPSISEQKQRNAIARSRASRTLFPAVMILPDNLKIAIEDNHGRGKGHYECCALYKQGCAKLS
jgi:hypothetical protein